MIDSWELTDLVSVLCYHCINIVGTVILWHIYELCAYISHRITFINEVLYGHITGHCEVFFGFYDVIITIQHTRHLRCERQDCEQFTQLETVHWNGNVLQRAFVSIVCRHLNTRPVIGKQAQIGWHTMVPTDVNVVGIIHSKRLITQYWLWWCDGNLYPLSLHSWLKSKVETLLPSVIEDGYVVL